MSAVGTSGRLARSPLEGAPTRRARRAYAAARSRAVPVSAVVLLWCALVVPDRPAGLTRWAVLRLPVEGVVLVGVALLLPTRWRRVVAAPVGVVIGISAVLRVVDLAYRQVLDRPFNPVTDWGSLGPAYGVLRDSVGRTTAVAVTALIVVLLLALVVAVGAATLRVTGIAVRHRGAAVRAVLALGVAVAVAVPVGATGGPSLASASAAGLLPAEVSRVHAGLLDRRAFGRQVSALDRPAAAPAATLLAALHGKDVLLVFVESYGRVAVQGSSFSPQVDADLTKDTATLRAAGFSARSAFLTSPTFGGSSWLAHSTLQSGLWIDNQASYVRLQSSGRSTLTQLFGKAGWRTVVDIPSSPSPWPQGQGLYHYDVLYGTGDVGYAGPAFSYARIPDQYTLEALRRRELAPTPRSPVMAEIDLVSSHTPWAPLPRLVPWAALDDGAVFAPMPAQGQDPVTVWRDPAQVRAAYGASIRYSLSTLVSFVRTYGDDDLVMVVLGDHQPATIVTGSSASHDVPVSIVARDPRVLDRIASWGWQDGLLPRPNAPVWRMDTFRDRFLSAYAGPAS